MLMRRPTPVLPLLCIVFCCPACRRAATSPPAGGFAVEFPASPWSNRPTYTVVRQSGVTSEMPANFLHPLAGRSTPAPLDTLKLDYQIDRDKLIITVYALAEPHGNPLRYAAGHQRLLGTHSARLDQSIEFRELTKIGYQPFTVKIVTAKPPVAVRPTLLSKVPSIQIDLVDEDRMSYTLALRNVSSRGVVSYALGSGTGHRFRESIRSTDRPLIAPGAVYQERFFPAPSGRMTPHGLVEDPNSNAFVFAAALFSDGSHEGDPDLAAELAGRQLGYLTQRRRLEPIVHRVLEDSALDDTARIARIRSALVKLSYTPDAALIRKMKLRFSDLSDAAAAKDLKEGLDFATQGMWGSLWRYEHGDDGASPRRPLPPLPEWLPRNW